MPQPPGVPWRDDRRSSALPGGDEAHLIRRALRIAQVGYWRSESIGSDSFWISPELADMYGLPTEDGRVAVRAIRERYEADAAERLRAAYEACWRDGAPYEVRGAYRRDDGARREFAVFGEAKRDADGAVVMVSGIVRDITDETEARRGLALTQQRLVDFVATASDWCWETDAEHRFVDFSGGPSGPGITRRLEARGLTRLELPVPPEERPALERHGEDLRARRPFRDFVYSIVLPDGERAVIRTNGKPVFDEAGTFLGYRGTATDITALRQAEDLLDERTQALREAHRLGKIGTWSYRPGDSHVTWAPECCLLLGLDPDRFDPTYENVLACFRGDGPARIRGLRRSVIRTGETETVDVQALRPDGSVGDFAITCKADMREGRVFRLIGTIQDISERMADRRRLENLAYYDPLTGLANRALFKRELASVIDAAFRQGTAGTLMLVDLDRFKEVNDSLGHAAGDELLTKVADLMRRELGPNAFLARLGGDEFAILPERPSPEVDPVAIADRLIARLSEPMDLAQGEAFISATIGIANLPEHGTSVETAMRNADLALYMAKEAGRGHAMMFDHSYAVAVDQRIDLARHLRHAIEAGSLHAFYQPQVELPGRRVTGFEALLRWTHPERGPISPAEFIPIAESSGLIVDLGLWVLRESCRQARAWLDQGLPTRTVSVNVSPAQFWSMDFETAVSAVLAETGLPPHLLCLEITENLFVDHTEEKISRTLAALSALGVRLALDDFGTGYSSLGYLTRLPFDRLKVDRSFVDGIATRPDKRKLLAGIIALSRGLGMTVVAEGAEREAEVAILAELGCDCVQGYVFSRPVEPEAAPAVAERIERHGFVAAPPLVPAQTVRAGRRRLGSAPMGA